MQFKTMIAVLALLINVNACAHNETSTMNHQTALPLSENGSQWAFINSAGQLVIDDAVITANAELLDSVSVGSNVLVATVVGTAATPRIFQVNGTSVKEVAALPSPDFLPETLCMAVNPQGEVSLFIVDERGSAEHWLVYAGGEISPIKVRNLPIPPNTIACDADSRGGLFVLEEGVGIWRYEADPERPSGREIIDLVAPRGQLAGGAEAISVVGDELIAVAADTKQVFSYRSANQRWTAQPIGQWAALGEAESLRTWVVDDKLHLIARDDDLGHTVQTHLSYQPVSRAATNTVNDVSIVKPIMQTEPVVRFGDAADDPAIWVHPTQPELSRVLGTDKKHGLGVYSLQGQQLDMLETGRLNNVDLRYGFDFGDGVADIAVATQRDENSLSVYRIHPTEGSVVHVAELPTGLEEIYGLCMYQDGDATYAIANGKSGRFEQYLISATNGKLHGTLARNFAVDTQPEGCVADDKRGRLFVGEEDIGVWTLSARAEDATKLELVKAIDSELVADVEGLALYPAVDSRFLIVSSQGDDAYLVLNAHAPFEVLGKFSVGNNLPLGIDAISETDGLEVTHRSLGKGLEYGAFIAQDGHNVMPEQPQNFKLVPWQDIARELQLND
ncbi:phytase [Gilvimarinus sp. SDUM040013]|uniref:Phytase n=1 Tax=Gilvimarinus gilvus TaxID=3058038 RepID=A0ABU4RVR9_9GAMM|nr:phytase [Gilvimarinus sp. SDUM040013]MDO3387279.1 phytase [Gilvimarinus sp. SDUM040013]MDX6848968.1 phytase [Gilvimarinus sp. SDUM040013]